MLVHVAQRHVKPIPKGQLRCQSCPVANALYEATRRNWIVSLRGGPFAILAGGSVKVALPESVGSRIKAFDTSGAMESFAFEFDWRRDGG